MDMLEAPGNAPALRPRSVRLPPPEQALRAFRKAVVRHLRRRYGKPALRAIRRVEILPGVQEEPRARRRPGHLA